MHNQTKAYIYAGASVFFWSTVATAFKLSLRYFSPFELIFYSSFVSILIFAGILTFTGRWKLVFSQSIRDLWSSVVLGFLSPVAYYLILFKAYDLLPAQVAQPLNYTWTIVLVLLSVPLLKQRLTWRKFLGVIIGFIGAFFISTQGKLQEFKIEEPFGVALAIGSSVFWALYWIFNVRDKRDDVVKLFMNFVFGFLMLLVIGILFYDLKLRFDLSLLGPVYIGFFEMGFTFYLWMRAMQLTTSSAKIANLVFFSPFLSLIFIHYILGEQIYWTTVVGLVLIIVGILIEKTDKQKV